MIDLSRAPLQALPAVFPPHANLVLLVVDTLASCFSLRYLLLLVLLVVVFWA